MASETIKALLIIGSFGLLGSAFYWTRMRAGACALVPVRLRRDARRR
jgi:hypothetical protein